jgi:fluoroquinolone transport system permease protein
MLIFILSAPVLSGLFFKLGVPYIETLLSKYLQMNDLLTPYYLLFDLLLASLTPLLYCFAAAYIILGEIDDGISKYLAVTPIGKKGYLISRIGIPTLTSWLVTMVTLGIFHLSFMTPITIIMISIMTALLGMTEALLIVSTASNKVEGMAVSKLSGLCFIGLATPFFLNGNMQYILFCLPTLWIAKYALEINYFYALLGMLTSIGWITYLYKRFKKKIM